MKQYELMVIVDPDLGENGTNKRLNEVKKLLKDHKGEIFFEDVWGIRDLAYPIKKRERGFYAVLNFTLEDPQELTEMEKTLRLENEVLRHMVITLPKGYEPKSYLNDDEEEEEEKEKKEPTPQKAPAKKAAVKKETPVKEEKKEEKAPAKTKKEEKKKDDTSLEEVDAKLKSIIDNPDINF